LGAGVAATSSGVRIITVLSLACACFHRARCSPVSTSLGLISAPEPATSMSDGTVTA
jgi:hypothetical protein